METSPSRTRGFAITAAGRLKLTILLALALIAFAVFTNTHVDSIDATTQRTVGLSPSHLAAGEWWRLLTSMFFTVGGWNFYASLGMLIGCVGAHEWRFGSLTTALSFFGFHIATMLIELGILLGPLYWIGHPLGDVLYVAHDVGPSAGYYGCLGALLASNPKRSPRGWMFALVFSLLAARVMWSVGHPGLWEATVPANLAHVIAYPLGALSRALVRRWCQK